MRQGAAARPYTPEPRSSTPLWVWLVVGALMGTGGTLLTSALWLPEREPSELAEVRPESDSSPDDHQGVATAVELAEPAVGSLETAEAEQVDGLGGPIDAIEEEDSIHGVSTLAAGPPIPAFRAPTGENDRDVTALLSDDGEPIVPDATHARNADAEAALRALIAMEAAPAPRDDLIGNTRADDLDKTAFAVERDPPSEQILPAAETPAARDQQEANPATKLRLEQPTRPEDEAPVELPTRIRQALQREDPDQPGDSATAPAGGPLYRVQLAAVNNEAAAQVYWREVNERLPGVFADVQPIFDERLVDERLFLRIWVGAFDNRVDALGYCGWLKQQGQDCFVTRVDKL